MQQSARRGCMDDLWPSKPENFRSTIEHMMELTYDLACNILSLLEANACPTFATRNFSKVSQSQ